MSKRLTLAQVAAQLEAANAAYERLAAERDSLRAECAQLTEQLIAAEMRAPKPRAWTAAPADRKAAMAAAKAEAARTGRCVRAF